MPSYVLHLLHFNLQYCAGGLDGLYDDWPTDTESLENQIIDESFAPVLDVLDAHPEWTFDIELQAYMIEVLAARRPEVLGHLRDLTDAGQVELISVHYSDQLWTAYPWRDEEVSLALTRSVFEANDLPLSDVVWTQEGQFGQGMLERMPGGGYAIAVMPHNLAGYIWGSDARAPLYSYAAATGDVQVVLGGDDHTSDRFSVEWYFLDDGELYTTGNLDPYLGPAFLYNAEATQRRVADLEAAERDGARIIGVHDYVAAIAEVIAAEPLPPVIDGTWQPDDTRNLYRWMGGSGLWDETEQDDAVLTSNTRARHIVEAAEVAGGDPELLERAWRELLLAEVSDATGWNPYSTEVQYALDHATASIALAERSLPAQGVCDEADRFHVDLLSGSVASGPAPGLVTMDSPPPIDVVSGTDRPAIGEWGLARQTSASVQVYGVTFTFPPGEDAIALSFPWDGEQVVTIPALLESPVTLSASDVAKDTFALPLPSGLLRLSDGVWLVQETSVTHLAAVLSKSGGTVQFKDETNSGAAIWRYRVVISESDEDAEQAAVALALALNLKPKVTLPCPVATDPPPEAVADPGCSCNNGSRKTTAWVGVVGMAIAWTRRRRFHSRTTSVRRPE
jgi:hypothetical protein